MKKVLYIILIFLITLAIFSCAEDEPFYSNPFTDTTAPVIEEVTFVTTPTNDSTPDYTFSSDEAGTITYGGSCSSSTTSAIDGNNTITLVSLNEGTYSDCTITVTDEAGNISITLTITSFIVDTTVPVISGSTITTPTNDSTPNYTFSSDEAGTITYGGSCSSANKSAISGNNIITLNSLSDGTYSNCTITVTDSAGNSVTLNITSFTVAIPPTIEEVTFVTTPTNDSTPDYTFSSDEAGTITYGGSCSSTTTSAIDGNNTITFYSIHSSGIFLVSLNEGTYSDCTITVTDSAGNVSNTHKITPFIVDLTAATLAEVTAVTTPTNDSTPDYTFSSSEAGTITYGGSCFSITTSATTGNNTITLISLNEGTYKKCKITVTDSAGNSVTLNIGLFVIDTTAPTVSSISPTDNQSSVSITDNITVTFSDAMDTTYVTTNTDNTSCYGNLGVSSDNFSSCVQMASAPASSNSNMTFTLDPYDNLTVSTTYKTRVTTGVKDAAGNTLSSQYETSSGFKTASSATAIATGAEHSCALLDNASVKCWGLNDYGQLGIDNTTTMGDGSGEMAALTGIDLGTGRTATAIEAGAYHSCALLDNASVKCWGRNNYGQLGIDNSTNMGDGSGEMAVLPSIDLGTGRTATAISAASDYSCALLDNASVKCWGLNDHGQLGIGNTTTMGDNSSEMAVLTSIDLGTGRTATAIAAGYSHTCALLDNASVKCWGYNNYGHLGIDNTTNMGDNSSEMGDNLPVVDL